MHKHSLKNYDVKTISVFERQAKRLLKKFPSLRLELTDLVESLKLTPLIGTPLGNNCFKIRIAIASRGRGKSGGARVISYVHIIETTVFLLSIYDKSIQADITDKELKDLLSFIEA